MSLMHLFGEPEVRERQVDWRPDAPPQLDGIDEIELDFETDGLDWWNGAKAVGVALGLPDGTCKYYPWAHLGGGNLDEAVMKRWFQREVRGKRITNAGIKYDNHIALNSGIDFEAQDNILSDVQHYAALLDDYRRQFNLNILAHDFLGPQFSKVQGIDASRMKHYHAGEVADYAAQDVRLVQLLKRVMIPKMQAEDLMRVSQLEDECIFATCEMERNGIRIDVEKLDRWLKESEQAYLRIIYTLFRETGMSINPDKPDDMMRLFHHLKIPITEKTAKGKMSIKDEIIKKVDHPLVVMARNAGKLKDLRSKYLLKYKNCVSSDGILRYALHQLRGDEGGTIQGRYSSAELAPGVGTNAQQILALEKQKKNYGDDFIVRELLVAGQTAADAERGVKLYSADAMQIEYRVFAHLANRPSVIKAYEENPMLSFHQLTWEKAKQIKPDIPYKPMKNLNFAKMYGAKLLKLAIMLEDVTVAEADAIRAEFGYKYSHHPKLANARQMNAVYREAMPEVDELLEKASRLADKRGYVHTLLGRRIRFPFKERLHKALNGVNQGGAADLMKLKLVELHKNRKRLGYVPRLTVHDQAVGDVLEPQRAQEITDLLNVQAIPLRVKILWDASVGNNLRECDEAA